MGEAPRYRRILLKLSGEALLGSQPFGIEPAMVARVAEEVSEVCALGVEVAVVIGGGNIIRGVSAADQGIDRSTADSMGMLATIINALALQDALEKRAIHTRVMTAFEVRAVAEPFIRRRAKLIRAKPVFAVLNCSDRLLSPDFVFEFVFMVFFLCSAVRLRSVALHKERLQSRACPRE
jgi:uridylate kinase